jgi:hypothetical protein
MSTTATPGTPSPLRPDREQLASFWRALVPPGDVHEVRITDARTGGPARLFGTTAGYFTDERAFVEALSYITGLDAQAVYVTLNPVRPILRARADNRLVIRAKATASDADIQRRRHFLIDVDPGLPAGISATDVERDAALAVRDAIHAYLDDAGWPDPLCVGMSGNGGSLIYRIDLPNHPTEGAPDATEQSLALVTGCLLALGELFGVTDEKAGRPGVDTSVGNASRITKVFGTVAAKGDDCPHLGRPWRLATAELCPEAAAVSRLLLEALAAVEDVAGGREDGRGLFGRVTDDRARRWTVPELLTRNGIGWTERRRPYGIAYQLDRCLTSDDHLDGASIIENTAGRLGYHCHHNRCAGKAWRDVRGRLGLDARRPGGRSRSGAVGVVPDVARDELDPVRPFPLETLPPSLRALAEQGAGALVAPVDFIATPLLVAAGAAIGDALEVELKPSWREGANLYAATVGDPGSKKSPAMTLAMRPVYRIQKRLAREYDAEMAAYKEELAAWEAKKKAERGPKPEPPEFRHLVTTDATTEALAPMLLASKGLVLSKDELTGWVRGMDQFRSGGKGADRQHYLSMWSRTLIKVDRKASREPIIVPRPCLSVIGGIQPDLLPDLADAAQREDGFVDRLLWSYPDGVLDRWTKAGISPDAISAVEADFERLYRLEGDVDEDDEPVPRTFRSAPRLRRSGANGTPSTRPRRRRTTSRSGSAGRGRRCRASLPASA